MKRTSPPKWSLFTFRSVPKLQVVDAVLNQGATAKWSSVYAAQGREEGDGQIGERNQFALEWLNALNSLILCDAFITF
jgi:hypothetical protein